MKKLHLIRHAKSSWADDSLSDKQRPLNKRGQKSCGLMAKPILNAGCKFENVFCSSAIRTQLTIDLISKNLPKHPFEWQLDDDLYTFDMEDLLAWCQKRDNSMQEVVIIGHNPALTDLCNYLSSSMVDNMPTCAYAQLSFEGECWQDLAEGSMELMALLKPKMLKA